MTQNKFITKTRQAKFTKEIDDSIVNFADKFKRSVPNEIKYRMEIFEQMLKRGEIKEYENAQ